MKNRFFLVVSIVFLLFSCSQFVNLGDKSADGADNTEGLPDELYENDSADKGAETDYGDWNEDSADTEYYEDGGQGEYEDSEQNAPYPDEDCTDLNDFDPESEDDNPDSWAEPTDSAYVFPESNPFPEGFSNDDCNYCGETPEYEPVCCNGIISVFNSCFANCYAVNSSNKICTVYKFGLCEAKENSDDDMEETPENDNEENDDQDAEIVDDIDDDIDDDDAEMPDSDEDVEVSVNECGCYPDNQPEIFSCGGTYYFITECLAECHCEDPQKLFF